MTSVLTLTGTGGVGKTRLALEVGARGQPAFVGGVAWVPPSSVADPGLVLPAVAQALGLVEAGAHRFFGPGQASWLDQLEREHDNFRAALRWCIERDDAETGLRIAAALLALPQVDAAGAPRAAPSRARISWRCGRDTTVRPKRTWRSASRSTVRWAMRGL